MSARKEQIVATLEAQAKARRQNKLLSWKPYPKQREFLDSTALPHTECGLQCGNQFGKSTTAAYAAAVHATGLYPDDWWKGRRFEGPTDGWVASESATSTRDTAQTLLCGPPNDEEALGTGFLPRSTIIGRPALSHGASGAFDSLRIRHVSGGVSTITFKSYEQSVSKFQSKTLHWVWCDEEPPMDIYTECLARLLATNGLMMATFTPLYGSGRIVPRFRESNPSRSLVRATMDDALHLVDPARREAILKMFPGYQRGARLRGEPMMGSGSVFEGISIEDLLEPVRVGRVGNTAHVDVIHAEIGPLRTETWGFLWAVDFGINEDHAFGAVLLGHDRERDIIYILEAIKMINAIPPQHAQRMRHVAANVRCTWPHDGNNRERGSGETLAAIYKREGGLNMLPSHATFETGGYSTEAGILELINRMRSGRFKVATHLVDWRDEFQSYHRKDGVIVKSNDDLMSATRIGVIDIRNARPAILGGQRAIRNNGPVRICDGAELSAKDLWG